MEFRRHRTQRVAAAQSGLSERTGRRIERDPRLPSQKSAERPLRRQTADPLDGLWESDILPLLLASPGLRPVTLLDEMRLRRPDRDWDRLRRTLERRVRVWRAEHGPEREVIVTVAARPPTQCARVLGLCLPLLNEEGQGDGWNAGWRGVAQPWARWW